MTTKCKEAEAPAISLKDESARLRWELFHRAIAHAKRCSTDELVDSETAPADDETSGPALSIVR